MANVFLDKIEAKKEYKITLSFLFSIPISMSWHRRRVAFSCDHENADVLLLDKASTFFLFL